MKKYVRTDNDNRKEARVYHGILIDRLEVG
jgi:hypothetical protein